MDIVIAPFGALMGLFYQWTNHYFLGFIGFALFTKVILLPLAVWVHKNSIKMVGIQPELNRIKAKHFGNGDKIAEEQSLLYKKVRYNPLLTLIPLCLQIALLIAVIEVIYHPLTFLLGVDSATIGALAEQTVAITGENQNLASFEITMLRTVQNPAYFPLFVEAGVSRTVLDAISSLELTYFGLHFADTPIQSLGWALIVPLLAGFSAWLMCTVQNRANVLQSEQSKTAQWTSLLLSVGLSLYLGLFVPIGVGVYWIFGNFYAILQLSLLNLVISPKKEVDFADLEDSRAELLALQQIGGPKKKWFQKDQNDRREKADYKRFFSIANKKLVFYSERSGYYKYFKTTIESLLLKSNITIHYITSDPDDAIFDLATTHPQIKPYYIGEKKLIFLMMKMDADVVVTTLPDLNQFHLKRSYVRDDVHYVYLPHDMLSTTMTFLKGAFDYYDAIMCVGQHQINELRESESIYHLPEKALIPYGYGLLEGLLETYQNNHVPHDGPPKILIAPSWQFDNIFDSCLDELIESLMEEDYQLILRPHPEYCKRFGAKMARIVEKYPKERYPQIEIELDFSSNHSIYSSDLLITDWSKIAYEFSFCTLKPSLFINTKPKILNVDHERYTNISTEITLRDKVGISLEKSEVNTANTAVKSLLETQSFRDQILEVRDQTIFNLGKSGEMSANYLLTYLKNKSTQKKESK